MRETSERDSFRTLSFPHDDIAQECLREGQRYDPRKKIKAI